MSLPFEFTDKDGDIRSFTSRDDKVYVTVQVDVEKVSTRR